MNAEERDRFDRLVDRVVDDLPAHVRELFGEAPLILEDRPTKSILQEFGINADDETLCGLYSGTPLTERSVDGGLTTPDQIYLFREGILDHAGGWESTTDDDGKSIGGDDAIAREIRITILHEVGHHFGLDEDDLLELGYD